MQDHPLDPSRFNFVPKRSPVIPNGVLGMLVFVFSELMLFAGMISAFLIVKANAVGGIWPPPGQPRLPIGQTAFNTALLFASGVALYLAHRAQKRDLPTVPRYLLAAIALACGFVGLQGSEWVALISEGLTLTSSTHGAFFYLIVGTHGLHALAAVVALGLVYLRVRAGRPYEMHLWAAEVFWYFVVGVWPILYWQVYL